MPHIYHAILIGSSKEKVYHAIASQSGLSAWWTPHTKASAEVDSIARFSFGPDYFKEMKIVKLTPFEEIQWHCITGAHEWIGTDISFHLLSGDKETLRKMHPEMEGQIEQLVYDSGTLLIFHHKNWDTYSPMFAECNYTWGQFLRSLKLLCETGKGKPWPHQHRL
ncbi:SRPBCC domain-containing protein [Chryseobacterium pennae]|uniref:SRPBCC domain-containing protein n=1 Tax=Chryseobacterium pennae TaxID=2258962 RepID=A0A3D9CC14_9FLAO|nr:SRPBCC domain-containing protein [Chryseobacterium pennae]REC63433.1 SRPBCC domain-containing protein [Chryseobacterium pennae]